MRVTVFDNDCFLQFCEKESEILNSTVATLKGELHDSEECPVSRCVCVCVREALSRTKELKKAR